METKTSVKPEDQARVLFEECHSPLCRHRNPAGKLIWHVEIGIADENGISWDVGTCGPKNRVLEFLARCLPD